MRERRRKEEEEARLSLERARKAFLQVRAGGGASESDDEMMGIEMEMKVEMHVEAEMEAEMVGS